MKNLLADIQIAPSGGFKGIGPLGNPTDNGVSTLSTFISDVVGVMTIIAVIWTVFTIMSGAISIISSGGDKQALESARKKITTGIIGLIIVIVSLLIIEVIGYLLGIPGILDIKTLFNLVGGSSATG